MSEANPFGWAVRKNGSCLASEVDCGETVNPFRNCCPHGSFCPHADNVACCPTKAFCDDALNGQPHCANSTWDMYINGGYFCCEQGTTGYAKGGEGGSNGCGLPGYELQADETSLSIVSAAPKTTSSSSTPTSTPTTTPSSTSISTATNPADSSSSHTTNTGAIAGGVVGGVAGAAILIFLAWYFIRRSRKSQQPPSELVGNPTTSSNYHPVPPAELAVEGSNVSELPGPEWKRPAAELPTSYR